MCRDRERIVLEPDWLKERLAVLPGVYRAAFATACAERLWPTYRLRPERREGELAVARAALDRLWSEIAAGRGGKAVGYSEFGQEVLRERKGRRHPLDSLAGYAVRALVCACRSFETGDVMEAYWAAYQEQDAAYELACIAGRLGHCDPRQIDRSPYMQLVFRRELADMEMLLAAAPSGDLAGVCSRVRAEAEPVARQLAEWAKRYEEEMGRYFGEGE